MLGLLVLLLIGFSWNRLPACRLYYPGLIHHPLFLCLLHGQWTFRYRLSYLHESGWKDSCLGLAGSLWICLWFSWLYFFRFCISYSVFSHFFACLCILFYGFALVGSKSKYLINYSGIIFPDRCAFIYISHPKAKGNPSLGKKFINPSVIFCLSIQKILYSPWFSSGVGSGFKRTCFWNVFIYISHPKAKGNPLFEKNFSIPA